jgi:hypothetical protein
VASALDKFRGTGSASVNLDAGSAADRLNPYLLKANFHPILFSKRKTAISEKNSRSSERILPL